MKTNIFATVLRKLCVSFVSLLAFLTTPALANKPPVYCNLGVDGAVSHGSNSILSYNGFTWAPQGYYVTTQGSSVFYRWNNPAYTINSPQEYLKSIESYGCSHMTGMTNWTTVPNQWSFEAIPTRQEFAVTYLPMAQLLPGSGGIITIYDRITGFWGTQPPSAREVGPRVIPEYAGRTQIRFTTYYVGLDPDGSVSMYNPTPGESHAWAYPVCQYDGAKGGTFWGPVVDEVNEATACPDTIAFVEAQQDEICNPCDQVGNPIAPMTGAKIETVDLGMGVGGKVLQARYDTSGQILASIVTQTPRDSDELQSFGPVWSSTFHKQLAINQFNSQNDIKVMRGDGSRITFVWNGAGYTAKTVKPHTLTAASGGGYIFTDGESGAIEHYDGTGTITSEVDLAGNVLTYTHAQPYLAVGNYSLANALTSVEDQNGRMLTFQYSATLVGHIRLSSVKDSNGGTVSFTYDSDPGNLLSITWNDGKTRGFLYENQAFPWAMTGVIDESGNRFSTFGYDGSGRANITQHYGGVDSYSVSIGEPATVLTSSTFDASLNMTVLTTSVQPPSGIVVTGPGGDQSAWSAVSSGSYIRNGGVSMPAGSGCAASNSNSTYDNAGNLLSRVDLTGAKSCYAYNLKNQKTVEIKGLQAADDCSLYIQAASALPSGALKTVYQWHPIYPIVTSIEESGAVATFVLNGDVTPVCAPAALLPSGYPLPVVCKSITQAKLPNGTLDPANISTITYTYDSYGRLLTKTSALGKVTAFSYYLSTSLSPSGAGFSGHSKGDLASITDELGNVTNFNLYDGSGRLLEVNYPSGLIHSNVYDAAGKIISETDTFPGQPPRVTSYSYTPVRLVSAIQKPDGQVIRFNYDNAQKLISQIDEKGNSVVYNLDNSGNRIKEQLLDANGVVTRTITRSFDVYNRVQQVTGAGW